MMTRQQLTGFGILLALAATTLAQRPGPGFDPTERLRQFDRNKNGLVESHEMPREARPFLEKMAERHGLDPKRPIPIDKIAEAIRKSRGDDDRDRRDDDRDKKDSKRSTPSHSESDVPGFGEEVELEPVPGFGGPGGPVVSLEKLYTPEVLRFVEGMFDRYDRNKNRILEKSEWEHVRWRSDPNASDTNKDGRLDRAELCARIAGFSRSSDRGSSSSSGSSSSPSSSSSKSSSSSTPSSRYREYARSLLRQYDKNKNGVLEKSEYSNMKESHQQADKNRDGRITLDELAGHLAGYSKGRTSSSGSSGSSSKSRYSSSRRSSSSGSRGNGDTYRALTPTERLPSGLESWFARKDIDGDGQVQMSEYSPIWPASMIAEFKKHDRNGDGVITPEEHLATLKEE